MSLGSGAAGLLVAAVAVAALAPIVLAVVYRLVRQTNQAHEPDDVSRRARTTQRLLASAIDHVDDDTAEALGLRRLVLGDRVRISAATLAELDDRWEALAFLWFARPSQPEGFATSAQLAGLPDWAQDAVVLLDLRREVRLRGPAEALARRSGFYHHAPRRTRAAVEHTGSMALLDAYVGAAAGRREAEPRLVELLDDEQVWSGLLGPRPA